MKFNRDTLWNEEGERVPTTEIELEPGDPKTCQEIEYLIKVNDVHFYPEFLPRIVLAGTYPDGAMLALVQEGTAPKLEPHLTEIIPSSRYL